VFFAVKILNPSNPVNPVKKLPVGLFPLPRAAGLSITSKEFREANTLVPYSIRVVRVIRMLKKTLSRTLSRALSVQ
jgi:hypothetical protein